MAQDGEIRDQRLRTIVVVGTRPEAIKLFPVILALHESQYLRPYVIDTGQHPDLVKPVFEMAGITADLNLEVAREPNTLTSLVSKVSLGVEKAIRDLRASDPPGTPMTCAIMVHGDTSSAMAAALSAAQCRLPVLHVEAGLRTGDTLSPFPEELNRQIIARIAAFHLAPTNTNLQNLLWENVSIDRVLVTGNTAIDALQWTVENTAPAHPELMDLDPNAGPIVVVTTHRRENWGGGLERIATGIARIARAKTDAQIVVPMHPNPLVREEIVPILSGIPNVRLIEPLDYPQFARLLGVATLAITDSGGIQEEAPSVGTPVLVVREETERSEGVDAGTLRLVGTEADRIFEQAMLLLTDPVEYQAMASRPNPYGDGYASRRIVAAVENLAYGTSAPLPFGPTYRRRKVLEAAGYGNLEPTEIEIEIRKGTTDQSVKYFGPERRVR